MSLDTWSEMEEEGRTGILLFIILMAVMFMFLIMTTSMSRAFEEPAFKNKPYQYNTHIPARIEVDRYDETKLRNDSEVLVSKQVHASAYFYHQPQPAEVYEKVEDGDIKVTAQLCDDNSCMDLQAEAK